MIRRFSAPSEIVAGRTDHFIVGTASQFAEVAQTIPMQHSYSTAFGGMRMRDARAAAKSGHDATAQASEKFLSEVEGMIEAPTSRHMIIDDVSGAVPNVPAFLAGQPLTMRRKARRLDEAAPIAIYVDCTSSGGIEAKQLLKRGAAILALTRALSAVRPVELHFGTGMAANENNGYGKANAVWQFWQVETAPMDLARAAFFVANPACPRALQYAISAAWHGFVSSWPYHTGLPIRGEQLEKIVRRALPHVSDVIAIPAAHYTDMLLSEPVEWLRGMISIYSGDNALAA